MANNNINSFKDLEQNIKRYIDKPNLELLTKAWEFAKLAHTGQKRKSGEDYYYHPLATALILSDWKLDEASIIAGLLHDTVEDGGAKREDILKEFGEEITVLVDGVTKISNLRLRGSKEEEFVENLRKMFLAMAKDLRVILVKLADRLHNMKTLSAVEPEKQKRIAHETLEIFAPLAERLGMGQVKSTLDDLAFPYVYPDEYKKVYVLSRVQYKKAQELIKKMNHSILRHLANEGILDASVQSRSKHLYSLWRKLERQEIRWDFDKIHDIVAMRIYVETIPQCYTALGVVHSLYKPVPYLGISDFIAQPKPNGYQSIHTKVFGPGGRIVEVQIRTHLMHEQAEHGIAAHWAYSAAKGKGVKDEVLEAGKIKAEGGKLQWIKQLADWQKEIKDSKEFMEAVKFDALQERIYVFSPKGDVFELPLGATPIDFALAVHTGLAEYIKQAKVNGYIVPLDNKLKSGDVVEIIKSKNPKKPSEGWLSFVATNTARREISKSLRQ